MNSRPVLDLAARLIARAVPSLTALSLMATPLFAQEGESTFQVLGKAGIIGLFIMILSVVALAVIIENFVSLNRDKLAPPELIDEVQALFDEGQYQEAMELCENEPSFFTNVAGAGVAKIGHSFQVIEQSISEMGDEESIRLHQKI
jgi:biopolymer transport protein ExbB